MMFMSRRTGFTGVPAVLAAVAVLAPAAGQAAGTSNFPIKGFPKVFSNGIKATTVRRPAITVGAFTWNNGILGSLKCESMTAGVVFNETTEGTEKGFVNTSGYSTFNCVAAAPCKVKNTKGEEVEGIYFTAESPPEPAGTEAHPTGISSLPWTGELIERETNITQVLTHHVKVWIVDPPKTVGVGNCQGLELPFEDAEGQSEKEEGYELAPIWVNGTKNGLHPSHGEFAGEEGLTEKGFPRTGRLHSGIGPFYMTAPKLNSGGSSLGWELLTAQ